tara:strand:- start:59 stop:1771 length:1713 start_codon:yes stop_codon:yes gene_type:complete
MKKKPLLIQFFLQIFFLISISNLVYAKTLDKYNKSEKISSYFSGIVSLYDNEYLNSFNYLKKLEGLENSHKFYSQIYQHTLVNLRKFDKVYSYSAKIAKDNPNDFQSNLILGTYHLKKKQYNKALKYFEKLNEIDQKDPIKKLLALSLKGWATFPSIEMNEALNYLETLPKEFVNIASIQRPFIHCFYNSEKTEQAFIDLTSNDQKDFSRYIFFLVNYLNQGSKDKIARNYLEESLINYPNNLVLNQLKLDLQKKPENFSNQFDCKDPSNLVAEIFYITANSTAAQSAYYLSNFYLNLAVFLNTNFVSFETLYAENLFMVNNFDEAKKVYNKIQKKGKVYKWYSAKQISNILIKENNEKEAKKYLKKQYEKILSPNVYETYDYARFLNSNENYDISINYFTKVIEQIDENHYLYSKARDGRGVANERQGNWEEAESDFLNSLRVNPNQPYVINYLAYSWIEKGLYIEKSLKMLEKANELKKNDGYIIDSLGWALFKLKKFKEAKKQLQFAVRIMPSDPIINDHFADSLWMNNQKVQARYYWRYVLKLKETENDLKNKIKKKLLFGPNIKL